jgi:hypothetical protein
MPEGLYDSEFESGPTYPLYVIPVFTSTPGCQDYQAVFN